MDSLQSQVTTLTTRVDALHRMIEQVNDKTTEMLAEMKGAAASTSMRSALHTRRYSYAGHSLDAAMEHKDVLAEVSYPASDSQTGDRALSPEIQIQRLTAQLTAAYNRIAALEEQLLSQRVH